MTSIKVSLEDRQRAEILQLKMGNIQKDMQLLQVQVNTRVTARDELLKQMADLRREFQEKYNVDLAKVHIEDDGTIHTQETPGTADVSNG